MFRLKHAEVELRRKEAELEKTVCEYEKDRASHSTLLQSLKDLEVGSISRCHYVFWAV